MTVQAAIDLADAVIAFGGFRKPVTMGEIFSILEKVIGEGLAVRLTKMVGFRNILAYDYGKIDYNVVGDVMRTGAIFLAQKSGFKEKNQAKEHFN